MNESFKSLLRSKWALPIVGVVGFGTGAATGYWLTRRQYSDIQAKIDELESQTVEMEAKNDELIREFNLQLQQAAKVTSDLKEEGKTLLGTLLELRSTREEEGVQVSVQNHPAAVRSEPEEQDNGGTVSNIFDHAGDEWDYKTEIETRDTSVPYVIHVDEYVADENGWDSQSTLTWYEADQILTDSKDMPIYDPEAMIGPLMFGHGSLDPNVFYVRNEKLQAEYEILRDAGSYQEIVLGEQMEREVQREIKHANVRKFRDD